MEMNQFLDQAWNQHATNTDAVVQSLEGAKKYISNNEDIPGLARLATHLYGDHLGQWKEGVQFLRSLQQHPAWIAQTESDFAIQRSMAVLQLCQTGDLKPLSTFSKSDRARILALSAGMLFEQGQPERSEVYFKEALEVAALGLEKSDPAHRALAITGNNLACSLEEKANRTEQEVDLMILSAQVARKFWELAGGPCEVNVAEYRLSQTYLVAENFLKSFEHAQLCVEVALEHQLSDYYLFYAYEALALAEKAGGRSVGYSNAIEKMKSHYSKMKPEDQKTCEATLKRFE